MTGTIRDALGDMLGAPPEVFERLTNLERACRLLAVDFSLQVVRSSSLPDRNGGALTFLEYMCNNFVKHHGDLPDDTLTAVAEYLPSYKLLRPAIASRRVV